MSDELKPFIEPELEARLIALILGEASDFEREELEKLIKERPELAVWKARMENVHELVSEASTPSDDSEWKLSPERREKVLSQFGKAPSTKAKAKKSRRFIFPWRASAAAAALVAMLPVTVGLLTVLTQGDDLVHGGAMAEQVIVYSTPGSSIKISEESDPRPKKRAITSSLTANIQVPLPDIEQDLPASVDFGITGGFGSGWGRERKEQGGIDKKSSAPVPKVADYLISGNEGGNRSGEGAVRREAIDAILNNPQNTLGELELAKKAVQAEQKITTKTFSVPPNFLSSLDSEVDGFADDGGADPFADDTLDVPGLSARRSVRGLLEEQGMSFPEGSSVQFMAGTGKLIVRNTSENMDLMDSVVNSAISKLPVIKTRANEARGYGYYVDEEMFDSDEKTSKVVEKLQNVRLPSLDLKNASLDEALALIEKSLNSVDDDSFDQADLKVAKPRHLEAQKMVEPGDLSQGSPVIDSLNLKDVPLQIALQYIADKTKLRYKVNENGIQMLPLGDTETDEIVTRSWKVEPGFLEFLNFDDGGDDPFADDDEVEEELTSKETGIRGLLENQGVTFIEGSSAQLLENNSRLLVRNTPTNLELLELIVGAHKKDRRRKELEEIRQNDLRTNYEISATEKPDSTFSLNVSDVSFKLVKAALLGDAHMPAEEQIRVEEFVNAFDYQDASPSQSQKVSCVIEQAAHPLMQQRELMRIAMKTAALGRNATTPLRLTILLDRSGSMERADRAESVARAFQLLSAQLTAADEVTLVAFDRRTRLLAERLKGDQCAELAQLIRQAPTAGGTNLEEALTTGLQLATQQYLEEAQNRVILLTDGAANLGDAVPTQLAEIVTRMRKQGISFDACGVGADGLNDAILEELARQGDGRYYFLDRPEDADAGFAKQIAGALRPAAKNVKVQVIFNPERVGKYRLYGYKKHLLKKEDFRNDAVDAAEMAAEESGVAMYHYEALPDGRGEIGTVAVRFFDVSSGEMVERTWTIPYQEQVSSFEEAKPSLRLAISTIFFAERLKDSRLGSQVNLPKLIQTVSELKPVFGRQKRFQELQQMLEVMR